MSGEEEGRPTTTVEDPKEAAIRALLFAAPSPRASRGGSGGSSSSGSGSGSNRSLNTSATLNGNNGTTPQTPSPLSLSASAVASPSSSSNSLRVRTELHNPERSGSIDSTNSNNSTPTTPTTSTPTINGPATTTTTTATTTARHVSPPKWSQRHLHHHLPSANPSSNPSPAISPALTPLPSGVISPAILSPAHSGAIPAPQMVADKGKAKSETDSTKPGNVPPAATDRRKLSSKNLLEAYGDEDTLRQKLLELKDKRKKSNSTTSQVDQMLSASMEDLNITGEDINFDELESFLKESQEDHSVKEALTQGVELKDYGQKVDEELKSNENAIVPIVYIELRNDIGEMHSKVGGCIDILSAFEKLLTTFQGDLSNISDDIKNMQDQSMEKNIKITNRKAVISKLDRFIDDISLPPSYVEQLEKGQIDMTYLQVLASFNRKLGFISMQRAKGAIAIEDMYRKFNATLDKVIARVHKYVVTQTATIKSFAQLRDTQLELGSMSFLYQFLFIHAPDNARDVKAAYMDTCDKFYTNYYKSYINSMSKYLFDVATKNDVIGMEDSKLKNILSSKMTKSNIKASVFALGNRLALVEATDAPPMDTIISSNASTQPKLSYEELFRTQLKLLADQVNSEFFFVRDFFLSDDDVTFGIFPRCADLLVENVENYLANSYDAIGLLVVMCLIDRFSETIPENLDYLLTALKKATHSIFNRFGFIMEMNMASIRHANPQDLGPIDNRTHYVTRRYAELSASILTLYGTLQDPLRDAIAALLAKIRELMLKLLRQLSLELKDKQDQTVFLINNYDLVLSLVQTRGVNAEEVADFTAALTQAENTFVSLQLSNTPHVAQIASFVDDISPLLKTDNEDHINHPKYNQDVAEALLKQFSHQWREGIKSWHKDVLRLFTNFAISKLLFQKVADQMFSYLQLMIP